MCKDICKSENTEGGSLVGSMFALYASSFEMDRTLKYGTFFCGEHFPLLLIKHKLSVTRERIGTKYWLTACGRLAQEQ